MDITRIKLPKYKVGRYTLNEYELRCLMVEVKKGVKPSGIQVKDEKGTVSTIREDGRLSHNLYGLDINSQFTLTLIRLEREEK